MDAVGEVLLVLAVGSLLTVAAALTMTVFALRAARRRYRVLRSRVRVRGLGTAGRTDLPAVRAAAAATVASTAWWATQRDRHEMWRAVSSAQHAVQVAQRSGAPVGDLPALCGQLAHAATRVDAVLRASEGDRPWRRDAGAAKVQQAAADVQRAAVESLAMIAAVDAEPVYSAVRLEVAALAAGVRAAWLATRSPSL
jgi:hypothetical protein